MSDAQPGLNDVSAGSGVSLPEPKRARKCSVTVPEATTSDLLDRYKLKVVGHETTAGDHWYAVSGETYPYREGFREAGGTWNGLRQHWEFKGDDPSAKLAAWLESERGRAAYAEWLTGRHRRQSGLADVAQTDIDKPRHYWGHRGRLRERFLAGGDDALPDYELLELLLFYTVREKDTKELAKELLSEFGSLGRLVNADLDRFERFAERLDPSKHAPIDRKTVVLFRAVRTIAARLAREEVPVGTELTNWDKLIAYLRASMGHRPVEQFRLLFLDRRNVLIADEMTNEGSIDHTPVYPREVVKRALALDASAIIMVHNHPSNHPQPSRGDIEMTQVVQKALKAVGVVLHDHVIVSRKGHSSFKQMGLL